MNAASSGAGLEFATRVADMCFVQLASNDPEQRRAQVDSYKDIAREKHGRDIQVWTMVTVVQRDTQAQAESHLRHYAIDNADEDSVDAWLGTLAANTKKLADPAIAGRRMRAAAGAGGTLLVGDAVCIADQMADLSACGVDGLLLSWMNYEDGLTRLAAEVLPLLEQRGLRQPFCPPHPPA